MRRVEEVPSLFTVWSSHATEKQKGERPKNFAIQIQKATAIKLDSYANQSIDSLTQFCAFLKG